MPSYQCNGVVSIKLHCLVEILQQNADVDYLLIVNPVI